MPLFTQEKRMEQPDTLKEKHAPTAILMTLARLKACGAVMGIVDGFIIVFSMYDSEEQIFGAKREGILV